MTTIEIETPTGPIDALLDVPAGPGPRPGVVIIHDAMGFASDKEEINSHVAAAGYVALTPNLFSRGGWARCVTKVMRQLLTKQGQALDDVLAARDHLKSLPECTGKVGIAGFCMGGGFALVMSPKGFDVSAPFYGTPLPKQLEETLEGACPIVASFGARDPIGVGAPKKLQRVLDRKGITSDVKTYPKVGHSFANKLPAQPLLRIGGFGYNAEASEDAWARVFSFFGEHLRDGG